MVVQSLKGKFAIFRKQVCRQIERRKENDKPQCKIRPEQQSDQQVRKRFEVFSCLRVQKYTVQSYCKNEPQNRRISNIECRRVDSLRSIFF